jgi:hypothetical protein
VETGHNTTPAQNMRIMDWIKEYLKTGKAPEALIQGEKQSADIR